MLTQLTNGLRRAAFAVVAMIFVAGASVSRAAYVYQYAVDVTASVQTAPAQVRLNWTLDPAATGYTVSRKLPTATTWTTLTSLAGNVNGYTDGNVTVGSAYEYRIVKTMNIGITAYGYILAGVDAAITEQRGKLILVVDNTHAAALASELTRLQKDLTGDGWTVIRKDVSRTATVASVKNLIKTEYDADKANVKAAFLFGRVPVPRSGEIYPDGHDNHIGAWAADTYYADMDGVWTDTKVNNTSAERADNHNVPGDGRFDQGTIPSDLELAVGRVDMSNLTCFSNKTPSRSELDLLRAYLEKDHKFRHGLINVPRRGLIADNFGDIYGEAFAASGWRSFAPMFSQQNLTPVYNGQYFPTLRSQGYLFSYACGGGSYYTCAGVGSSDDFALNDIEAVFTMHFGSYFGDWDNESNFLRASLGSGYVLTTSWSGRPHWFYHRMALGEPIGHSARLSQNNSGLYQHPNQGARGVNSALLGDPTLRLHPVLPPSNLTGVSGSGLTLSWTGSSDTAIKGYNVYRAATAAGPFTRLNNTLVGATTFTDTAPLANGVYMVRAVKLESSPSGTYYNPSQGAFYPDSAPPPNITPTASSRFIAADTTTAGNWKSKYGSDGHWVQGASRGLPSYARVTPLTASTWTWSTAPNREAAPYVSNDSTNRIAACWYSGSPLTLDISLPDTDGHRVAAYFLDWDGAGRQQRIDMLDAGTGVVLDTRVISDFASGIYLVWEIAGNVRLRVTPMNGNAVVSAFFFDRAAPAPSVPAAPTDLSVIPLNSSQITLSWTDNSDDEAGFRLFRKSGSSGFVQIAMLGENATSYTDGSLTGGVQYTYRICGSNVAGDSPFSNESSTVTAPYAPTRLAVASLSDGPVQFTWFDNSANETGFNVYRRIPGAAHTKIGSTGPNVTTWTDITAIPGTRYFYTVSATGPVINSGFYTEVSIVAGAPVAPSALVVAPLNSSQIKLTWSDNSANETGFRIFRKAGTGAYAAVATLDAGSVEYIDIGLAGGTQYSYKICATSSAGDSPFSEEQTSTTAPYAPIRLAASATGPNQVQFTWMDNSVNETGFKVFRRIPGGAYSQIGVTAPNAISWLDTTAAAGTRYYYTVCAGGPAIDSGFSTEVSVTTPNAQ